MLATDARWNRMVRRIAELEAVLKISLGEPRDLLSDLNGRGFRICELVPKADASYLEGHDAKEWTPIVDERAIKVLAILLGAK